MSQIDWGKFTQKILIKASVQQVYNIWTSRNSLEKWFLRKAEFIQPDGEIRAGDSPVQKGDSYEWMWHGHPDEVSEHGSVIQANGHDTFSFVFGKTGIVTVHAHPYNGATMLELTQEQIPTDEQSRMDFYNGCSTGWAFHLTNLKNIMEGGADLRNKDIAVKGVLNS